MTRLLVLATFIATAGCGDAGAGGADAAPPDANPVDARPPGTNSGFVQPTAVTRAYELAGGTWQDMGPADWSCIAGAGEITLPAATTVALTVEDFQTGNLVPSAGIQIFDDGASSGEPIATATADLNGDAMVTLPAGTVRPTIRVTASGQLDTYTVDAITSTDSSQLLDLYSVSELTGTALPSFVDETPPPSAGLAATSVRDCADRTVAHAAVALSSMPGTPYHLEEATTYYFSAGSTSLPVTHDRQLETNQDGLFMIVRIPATEIAYLQAWGYVDGQAPGVDELTLLAEYRLELPAGGVVMPRMRPGLHR